MPIKKILTWQGLSIGVEYEPGDIRFAGTDHERVMSVGYGHIRNHRGDDGESLDCYIGSDLDSQKVFQLHQLTFDGEPDELKYMIGFNSIEDARKAYLAHMPKELLGGIVDSSIEKIKSHRFAQEAYQILEEAIGGRARVVRSRIAQGYGEKDSSNGYSYEDDPFVVVANEVNKLIDQGVPNISRLGHPEKGMRSDMLPPISQLTHYPPYKAVEVDRLTGEVYCVDRFFEPGTDKSIEWSQRAFRREYLPRSFESFAYCAKKVHKDGEEAIRCSIAKLFCIAWLDPDINVPGMGETARMTEVLERLDKSLPVEHKDQNEGITTQPREPCECGCTDPRECTREHAEGTHQEDPQIQSQNLNQVELKTENFEAGDPSSSGGNDTKGANKMDLTALANDLYTQGAPMIAALNILKGQAAVGATPQDIAMGIMSFTDMMTDSGAPPDDEMPMPMPEEDLKTSKPDLYEKAVKRFEALKKKKQLQESRRGAAPAAVVPPAAIQQPGHAAAAAVDAANNVLIGDFKTKMESMQKQIEEMANKPAVSPFAGELEKKRWAQYNEEKDREEKTAELQGKVYGWLSAESFGTHKLSDINIYPPANLKALATDAVAKILKESYNEREISIYIEGELKGIAARAPEQTEEATYKVEFGEKNDVTNRLAELREAADNAALATDEGPGRLEKRDKIAKKVDPKIKKIMGKHHKEVGPTLFMASEALRTNRKGFFHELGESALKCGLITNESAPYTNTATNLATQAFMSELIYNRMFEPADYLDVIAPLLRTELYDYKKGDPFGLQVGDEVKWALHRGVDPDNLSKLNVRTPGKSAVTSARLDRKYDSVSLQELAVEYLYELMQINSLRNTWNVDVIGAIGDYIAGLMNRSLSKFGMAKVDNTARQFRAVDVTEDTDAANLVVGNTIVVDGVSITFASHVSHIVRFALESGLTGTSVVPLLLVMPEYDKYNNPRGGRQTDIKNNITFTVNGSDYTWDDIGELVNGAIVDRWEGQNAKFAIDFNNCLLLAKSTGGISGAHLPEDLTYSYVAELGENDSSGNLVVIDFTTPDELTEAEHINNIFNTITFVKALVGKHRFIQDNVWMTSKLITDGLLVRAQRWQAQFETIGSTLVPNFEDFNTIGKIGGGVDLWGTDGELLGGDGVATLGRRGTTKVVVGEKVQASGMRWIEVSGAEGDATRSTTGQRELFRQTYAFASPRTRDDDGLADNEGSVCFKLKGSGAIA
jgi:hypothetical protein